jgi:hypothetical protein
VAAAFLAAASQLAAQLSISSFKQKTAIPLLPVR